MTAAKNTTLLIVPSGVIAALSERELAVRCFLYEQATALVFRRDVVHAADPLPGAGPAFGCLFGAGGGAHRRFRHPP